jgi:error-prone DNA polymerase
VDLLGLGALHQVHLCLDLLREHRGLDLTMATLPAEDEATYDMLCRADTVGTFQVESRAQMAMLPRLCPRNFHDLVVEVSIVRPGPITGGMVHPYLRRRQGLEPVEYPHPCLVPVLEKTLGVPLFQEQVMRLAVVAADYTPGEADQLRRDMAAWRRAGRLEQHHVRLVSRMTAKGIAPEFAERVFEQIRGFGEYGFPESHAASFALVSYATSWLKCHFPVEFACSLLNAQPMGFYSPATIVEDAKRHDVTVRSVDVLHSRSDCTLEPEEQGSLHGYALRMGLRYVKGLGAAQRARVEDARRAAPFDDLVDFVDRTGLDERALRALAEAGAFEGFGLDRRTALWQVQGLVRGGATALPFQVRAGAAGAGEVREEPPVFEPLDAFETVGWDYRLMHHSARGHPLGPLREQLRGLGLPDARAVAATPGGRRVRYAGLVICRQRPATAGGTVFMTLEDESGFVNVVVWQRVFEQHSTLARSATFLGVTGRVQSEQGVVHVVAEELWAPELTAPGAVASRDFH